MTREFDIVVFGATGRAGLYCIEQLQKASADNLRWAIAGRNEKKLRQSLSEVSSWLSVDLTSIPIIIADVDAAETLLQMAGRTRCVINTVGPYTHWGEEVIKACLEKKTHLLDLSGEIHYNESMRNRYHSLAQEKGVVILATAGFDSVPCEMVLQSIKEKFPGRINTFENYMILNEGEHGSAINTGTFNSLIEIFRNFSRMGAVRENAWNSVFQKSWQPLTFKKGRSLMITTRPEVPGYALPFLGGDKPVVSHSEFFRREVNEDYRRVEIQTYFASHSLLELIGLSIILGLVFVLAKFAIGRSILYRYPNVVTLGKFRKGGPSRQQTSTCGFTMYGIGTGWLEGEDESTEPKKKIIVRLDGPEASNVATAICIVQCAICLLTEEDKIPMRGGYLTPGFALENTSLLNRLTKNGFTFEVLHQDEDGSTTES